MLPLILQGRYARAAHQRRLDARGQAPSDTRALALAPATDNGNLRILGSTRPVTRRRHRSRNCRTFRLYGPFFQFADPEVDRQAGIVRRGRSFMGGRDSGAQEAQLQQQLEDMYAQVEHLVQQRELLDSRMITARTHAVAYAMDMTQRFYDLFGHGYDPINRVDHSREAANFLRATMVDDVVCTEFKGVDLFLRQYEMGTRNHASFVVELKGLSLVDNPHEGSIQVKAEATVHFRISRVTLENLFPSIIQDEDLVQQLIGKEYTMQYDKVFHFADGRIYQHESRIDMCSGLMHMVGDPFLALRLFQASLMTKHGHWKISNDVAEDKHELENSAL